MYCNAMHDSGMLCSRFTRCTSMPSKSKANNWSKGECGVRIAGSHRASAIIPIPIPSQVFALLSACASAVLTAHS